MAVDLTKTRNLEGDSWVMKAEVAVQYRASLQSQLEDWLKGVDRHTRDLPDGIEFECTPDMACCCPKAAWPMAMRKQFAEASDQDRQIMMLSGLQNVLGSDPNAPKAHVAGTTIAKH